MARRKRGVLLLAGVLAGCVGNIGDRDAAPGGESQDPLCVDRQVAPMPLKRLNRTQYDNAIRDLLSLQPASTALESLDEKVGPFDANYKVPITQVGVDEFASLAEDLANASAIDDLLPCSTDVADPAEQQTCASDFIATFGRRAYRRPLSEAEVARYLEVFEDGRQLDGFQGAIRLCVQAFLQSPHFLYHMETGDRTPTEDGLAAITPHELASRMSFFLWNSIPDDALLDAADAGQLADPEQLRAQAERMLADSKARSTITAFTLQWLRLDKLASLEKVPTAAVPEFDEAMREAMQSEVVAFADWVIRSDDSRYQTLLTASYTFYQAELAGIHGMSGGAPADPSQPVSLDPTQRAGVLTLPGWLATHAHPQQSSPVLRGVAVRENLLCQPLPPPPPEVNNTPPDPDPDATTRERFAQHNADPACAGCHGLIDGIGFGFERYDTFGAYRATENGLDVDDSGEVKALDDGTVPFQGAVELAHVLAESDTGRSCMQQQWLRFALGRPTTEADTCAFETLAQKFAESDYAIRTLLVEIVLSDPFRFQPGEP